VIVGLAAALNLSGLVVPTQLQAQDPALQPVAPLQGPAVEGGPAETAADNTISGTPTDIPLLNAKLPRPPLGPDGLEGYVKHVNNHLPDTVIELVLGRPRIISFKGPLGEPDSNVQVAVGDPSIVDLDVLSLSQIRVLGMQAGITDLTILPGKQREPYVFRISVVYDLDLLRAQLKAIFPEAALKLTQMREHLVIEGTARDAQQVSRILATIDSYLQSMAAVMQRRVQIRGGNQGQPGGAGGGGGGGQPTPQSAEGGGTAPGEDQTQQARIQSRIAQPQLINLIRVPTTQQVLLKVQIVDFQREAIRNMGIDVNEIFGNPIFDPNLFNGTQNNTLTVTFLNPVNRVFFNAIRTNNLGKILAEPNLICLNGQEASFLVGGEFPFPVPQGGGGLGVTVQFKEFGTRLSFVPHILDHERIRLTLRPEVSTIGTAVNIGAGIAVPPLIANRFHSTVEMKQGQTLAMAGLVQSTTKNTMSRIPGLGDTPYFGMLWSTQNIDRKEQELLVLVTPYLIEPMNSCQVPAVPGSEYNEPNDLEFFFLQRIEGRTGRDFRATTEWDDRFELVRVLNLEKRNARGQVGFSQ